MSRTREGHDQFSKYIEEETGRGWRKLRRELNGHEFLVYGAKTEDYIKALLASGAELKLNDMSDRIELPDGRPISDFQEAMILNRLRDLDMKDVSRMKGAALEAAAVNRYHPIRDYLKGLEWDGQNHFDALMDRMTMSSPCARVFFRKFLLGSIAKAIDAQQNFMLVFVGKQGHGKSQLVEWLCPIPKLFFEGPINPTDKDYLIRLINNWIWEVAELDSTTRKAEVSALKHFVSMRMVKVRVPFGRYDIDKPAAASMVGTVNEDGTGFLHDSTGNRRFAVIHLDHIDWSYYTDIDVNQLWAELYAAYRGGETWKLTPYEQEIQQEINEGHMTVSPLEELLLQYFEIDPSKTTEFTPTMSILEKLETLGLRGDQYRNKMELTTILTKKGLKPVQKRLGSGARSRGYEGIWYRGNIAVEVNV